MVGRLRRTLGRHSVSIALSTCMTMWHPHEVLLQFPAGHGHQMPGIYANIAVILVVNWRSDNAAVHGTCLRLPRAHRTIWS